MPAQPDDDGLGEMEADRARRRRTRSTPPPRHPRTDQDTTAQQQAAPAAEAPAEPEHAAPPPPPAPASAAPADEPEPPSIPDMPTGTDRRSRNIALKRFEDAAATWAAQVAKVNSRAAALKAMAAAAKDTGVPVERLAESVAAAAERHDVDPAGLPRDVARTVGLTRRKSKQ